MEKINKIDPIMKVEAGKPQKKYAVTIWDLDTKEILYQNDGYAGMLCFVEQVKSFGAEIEGNHQVMGWGHPMVQWYSLDQLNKYFQENGDAFIETVIKSGAFKGDIEVLRDLLKRKR